jgi:hypothetical protein
MRRWLDALRTRTRVLATIAVIAVAILLILYLSPALRSLGVGRSVIQITCTLRFDGAPYRSQAEGPPMRHDQYRRLHEACLAMAKQASEQRMRDRWSAMAEAWLQRATELHERSRSDHAEAKQAFDKYRLQGPQDTVARRTTAE